MNTLDWVLVGIALVFAFSGYRQGLVVGLLATIGLVAGGALAG